LKLDDFSLRYGDISIFKMAAAILELFTTIRDHTQSLATAVCQISCQSDTQI